ncbi:MAG: glycosyltransferase [Candidatus Krumholzibacteriota bacterium]|nr:glycosyltransferase [Candidatus Krumholzibacteriota bacterium]
MDNRINVLHVIDSLETGGAEKILYNLTVNMDSEKYRVSVCSMEDVRDTFIVKKLENKGFTIHFPGRKKAFDPELLRNIHNIIRKESIDIVHCHVGGEFYGHVAAVATRASVITTLHGVFPYSFKQRAIIKLCGLFKKNYKVAVSKELKSLYRCNDLIYNGVHISSPGSATNKIYPGLRDSSEQILVGIIGRLSVVKNHKNFLDAAAIISPKYTNVQFLIIGDGPLFSKLKKYARDKGLSERVVFTGSREDIPSILTQMDISVLSSNSEGLPMVILESMAASKPVVATEVGGIPELIINGETGILVKPRNSIALADGITKLVESQHLRDSMGEAARSRIKKYFSTDIMIKKYCSVYSKILKNT